MNANIKHIRVLSVIAAQNGFSLRPADAMNFNLSGTLQFIRLIVGDISGRLSSVFVSVRSPYLSPRTLVQIEMTGSGDEPREAEKVQRFCLSQIKLNE